MKVNHYSLIVVYEDKNGMVTGAWVQDCTGTLMEAKERAKEAEKVNSNRITVAVIGQIPYGAQWDIIQAKRLG